MTDAILNYKPEQFMFDITFDPDTEDIQSDEGLVSSAYISIYTDGKAELDDDIPDGTDFRRGWWADLVANPFNDRIGSRLWLIDREKNTSDVINDARQYCEEALAWMTDENPIASKVVVDAQALNRRTLLIQIAIYRTDGTVVNLEFEHVWRDYINAA